jgi:hypothetical protein
MNAIFALIIEIALTLAISFLLVAYLRPSLRKVLADLCGTETRAQFWTAFSNLLLICIPAVFALRYTPEAGNTEAMFFEIAGKLGGNLGGLLFALMGIGFVVSFFALVAPRSRGVQPK